jgi:tellurium resistance protein TerZ
MAINIRKPAKVNLVKGQRINLTKDATKEGDSVRYAFVGSNWSSLRNGRSVDLDSSILVYDENKNLIDVVYYRNLVSEDRSIKHSGDDRAGDAGGVMDAYDNEVITIDLSKITPKACYLVSILNSYSGHNFGEIPGIELRIYTNNTGNWRDIDEVIASYKLDNNKDFEGDVAIVLGHFYKHNNSWKFSADGIGTKEKDISTIAKGSARKVID